MENKKKDKLTLKIILFTVLFMLVVLLIPNIIYIVHEKTTVGERKVFDTTKQGSVANLVLSEETYAEDMLEVVEPFLKQYETKGYFNSFDEKEIYYRTYKLDDPKGNIVISHGFCENSEKYLETVYYFLNEGYSCYIMDHRGFGYSYRDNINFSKVYIHSFDEYANDFSAFVERVVIPETGGLNLYLYGHSMGGGIGAAVLEKHPEYFKKAVLSCPMMDPVCAGLPKPLAKVLANIFVFFGQGESYVIGNYDFDYLPIFDIAASGSEERYEYYFNKCMDDPHYQSYGATYGWLKSCLDGTDEILEKDNLDNIQIPILIFMAEYDNLIKPVGIYDFQKGTPDTTIVYVPEAKHELYSKEKATLIPYHATIEEFLND
jgi:lysophospholipase